MELFEDLNPLREASPDGVCMCIGVFDGVHRGHQLLLAQACHHARQRGLKSLAFTFRHHPLTLLAPPYAPRMLTTPEEKARLIGQNGIDLCLMLEFTPEFAAIPAERFLREIVLETCRARTLTCGPDFRFGYKGEGDLNLLHAFGRTHDIEVEVCDALTDGRNPVRSTRIRQAIHEGRLEQAMRLLGRPYRLAGRVVEGDRRGRTIGFPTANLQPPENQLVPGDGVYAVRAVLDKGPGRDHFNGMMNIGVRPTFQGDKRLFEVHLFDFNEDLYGRVLTVTFISKIRDEQRFESVEALVEQLKVDETACRALLNSSV